MKSITYEEALDLSLTQRQVEIAAGVHRPRKITRKEVEANFLEVFELVGGVPRLALWANDNYGEFVKVMAKLLPKVELTSDQGAMIYQSLVPQSQLNTNVVELKKKQDAERAVEYDDEPE